MGAREAVRDWTGWVLGWLQRDDITGDITATDFQGHILGFYRKNIDKTTDFYGRPVYMGDQTRALIISAAEKKGNGKK